MGHDRAWIWRYDYDATIRRHAMHWNHAGGWLRGASYRAAPTWMPSTSMRFDAFVDHLCQRWLGRPADARLQLAAQQATRTSAEATITASHGIARWLFPALTAALLDTPDHMAP